MQDNVYILDAKVLKYDNNHYFNPSEEYNEGLNLNIKSDKKIYESVRNLLISMNLDKKNIGKKEWNPLGDIIKLNDKVVIKPNMVFQYNLLENESTDPLVTNFSVIRPILDYVIIALKGTGKIIIGDAPVQECIFNEVLKCNGLLESIAEYNKNGHKIELIDFRKNNNPELECIKISLDNDSSLAEIEKYSKLFGITNYDLRVMHRHHQIGKHEYLFAKDILDANVIINIPKPKTHRIAGITACMKNFFGANAKKEYLPHHSNGSKYNHGDEYPERSIIKKWQSIIKNYSYKHNKFIDFISYGLRGVQKLLRKNRFQKGMWYGNDTIWRTILDINKIVLYANKNGKMTNTRQRTVLSIADMIVCGEKEGPLTPSSKKVGLLVSSLNQLNADKVICTIMGFDYKKIKYIINGYKLDKYKISSNQNFNIINRSKIVKDLSVYNKNFMPSDGWKDYLG